MSKWLSVLAVGLVISLGAVGCKSMDKDRDMDSSTTPKRMSTDACPHCPGNQVATADGKCPICGAKVK